MLVLGGPAGSGKTTVGRAVADRRGWQMLDSDAIRRDVHGVPLGVRLPPSAYTTEARHAIYREIELRAAAALDRHAGVVVTATLLPAPQGFLDAVAARRITVICWAPEEVLRRRIAQRPRDDASDATGDVAAEQLRRLRQEPATEADLVLDTSAGALADAVRAVELLLS